MAEETKMPFMARCKQFFGMKPGQTLGDFLAECKKLTYEDRVEFVEAWNKIGLPTEMPKQN